MFEPQQSTPWHRQLRPWLPPPYCCLGWTRPTLGAAPNAIRTKLVARLAFSYSAPAISFFTTSGGQVERKRAHSAALEQHRAPAAGRGSCSSPSANNPAAAGVSPLNPPTNCSAVAWFIRGCVGARHAKLWTNFADQTANGPYDEMAVLTQWPRRIVVSLEATGRLGYASFTIADGRAYTIEQRRRQEVVAAYDINTGRELWSQGWNAEYTDSTGDGPRTTPTWDDGRYAPWRHGELRCLDAKTGAVSWAKNILPTSGANLSWAMAASPLIVDDKVIVLPGGSGGNQ